MKYSLKITLAVLSLGLLSANASAVIISSPLGYDTNGLVGTATAPAVSANANIATVTTFANQILALGAGVTQTIGGVDYRTHDTDDYVGTLLASDGLRVNTSDGSSIAAGYDYVLAKYDGQNAGWVLFYLGGQASSIPSSPYNLWTTQPGQYGLSNMTLYRSSTTTRVPEPGVLVLMGIGLAGLTLARRRQRV